MPNRWLLPEYSGYIKPCIGSAGLIATLTLPPRKMAYDHEMQLQTGNDQTTVADSKLFWERRGYLEIALACVCFLAFVSASTFGFVYDDREQVLDNPYIQSWKYLARDFTSDAWAQTNGHTIKYYRPAVVSWMRINYTLFGTKAAGWHLTTVLLHVLATVLVFWLALRLLHSRWQALIAGLAFAVHPAHVESVAWVCGAVDPLFSIFFLASLLCYLNWREQHSSGWMAGSLVLAFLAMLAKEPGITLPAVVFAYALIFGNSAGGAKDGAGRGLRAAVVNATPFALVGLVYLGLRHFALTMPSPVVVSGATALRTLPGLLLFYLRLVAWPVGLTVFYDRQLLEHITLGGFWLPLLALALVAVILILLLGRSGQRKESFFSAAFALLVLCPVLWVRWFASDDFVHDRYLYLPIAGFAMLLAIVVGKLGGKAAPGWIAPQRQVLAVGAITVPLLIGTAMLQTCWASDLLLWAHCFKAAPHNVRVLNNLACSLAEQSEYQRAVPLFQEILLQNPNDARAQGNLGYTYYRMGSLPQAAEYLSHAVQLNPSDAHSMLYLGITYYKLGSRAPAEAALQRAITLDPSARGAHLALSVVLEQRGDLAGAIRETSTEAAYYPAEQLVERLNRLRAEDPTAK
jgi:protein O-mannosyl-transferase